MIFGRIHSPLQRVEMKEPIRGEELIALIPQKPPFVMISSLNDVSDDKCETSFKVEVENVLVSDGQLSPVALIENMAQSSAARTGYLYQQINKKMPLGVIGDVREFECTKVPRVGEEITTEITIEQQVFNVIIISGKVNLRNEQIASCKMKIVIVEEEKQ